MATFRNIRCFGTYCGLVFWLISVVWLQQTSGDTVHVMSVTPTPYGARTSTQSSFVCLLSSPDTNVLNNIQTGRHVLRGSTTPFNTLSLPDGSYRSFNSNDHVVIQYLPATTNSQGVYYCEASNIGLTTRVPVTILRSDRFLRPSNGQFTVTVSVGSSVMLNVDVTVTPTDHNAIEHIYWEKQGNETADFQILPYQGTGYTINGASEADAGVYYAYWRDWRNVFTGSLFRLIVRSCGSGKWGPPSCTGICDNCYNGGICDGKTGKCVCRPGFAGLNCLTVCGENKFGWDCEHHCGTTVGVTACEGSVFCMPDPVGCSCMTGWMGTECNQECPVVMYGAGCTQSCRCQSGSCDRFTGRCSDGVCQNEWTGDNCQIPTDTCPLGYYGTECLDKCNCITCDKTSGDCMNSQCYTGYWGDQCDIQCNGNCINCDKTTGDCMNSVCNTGYWGDQCEQQCNNCYNCDKATGCLNGPCYQGYWGEQCEHQCTNCNNNCDKTAGCTQCSFGYWGGQCEHQCTNCNNNCDKATGCTQCYSGYWGEQCKLQCNNCNNCDKTTGCTQCSFGYWGEQCELQCNNCNNCDKAIGCTQCYSGYWGEQCELQCNKCFNCDRITGCMTSECFQGYWGEQCGKECHCLYGVACDKVTAKCNGDFNYELSLCDPGYESDTGVNLDNCQQDSGCYSSCTKTCHCGSFGQCDPNSGCTQGCRSNWGGTGCQTGIVSMTYVKTNPLQPVTVTVIITGVLPDVNQIILTYSNKDSSTSTGNPIGNQNGQYLIATYMLESHLAGSQIGCSFPDPAPTLTRSIYWGITPGYYTLPALIQAPSVENIGTTSVTLRWNVWDPDTDTGDGPVIAYNVYDQMSTEIPVTTVQGTLNPSDTHINATIGLLSPGMSYIFYIRLVRPGQGGVGPSSTGVSVTTLSGTTTPSQNTIQTVPDGRATFMTNKDTVTDSTISSIPGDRTNVSAIEDLQLYIIIAVIVVLVILLALIFGLIWFLRRKRNNLKEDIAVDVPAAEVISKKTEDDDEEIPIMTSSSNRASMSSLGGIDNIAVEVDEPKVKAAEAEPKPPPIPTESAAVEPSLVSTASIKRRLQVPPVNVKDFANYVKGKRQNFGELRREWESLPKDLARPTGVGKKPENKGKNRFRNVVAYDHSRVVLEPLEDDPDSDYINACYIKGVNSPRAYIASQGPCDISILDHWRMVWQENVSVMVMACNIIENGRLKCVKYWPEKGASEVFGDFVVSFDREEQKHEDFLLRYYTITKEGEGTRKVVQIHYTNWPDKAVPKHCTPVLQLLQEINEHYQDKKAPLLVHCSAGAGRTGAILAIHAMMEMADQKGLVDIYNFVFSMRNNRANIVQTSEQYTFVHDAILEYLFCKNTFVKAEEFAARLKSLEEQNQETGNTCLEDEYAILNLVSPSFSSDRTRGSLKDESLSKLRSGDSIPVDSSRPYLMTSREDGDMSPYINAAFMDGYKTKDLFISTQMPLSHTVVDLWRLMYDYNCTCIVQLNAMDHEEEECPIYWPEEGTSEYGPFSVSLMEKESTQDFEIKTLRLVYTKRDVKSPIPVRHFQYTTWPKDDERPASSDGILKLISAVEKWQKKLDGPGPIVVLCMNAAGRTGAFCTIQTCLDQVREEQGANVLQNVKQLRINRTNMVDTPAKYLFCYETILEYLKAFDDYASKKSYQNVVDIKKEIKKPKEPKKRKKEDDAVIYGNQETIQELQKQAEADKEKQSADEVPQGASNVPSKSEDSTSSTSDASAGAGPGNMSPSVTKRATLTGFSKNDETTTGSPSMAKASTLSTDRNNTAAAHASPSIGRKATMPAYSNNGVASNLSPSSRRRSNPPVVSKTKPAARGRPKTYIGGKGTKPLFEEAGKGGAEGVDDTKKGAKKQEQLYQNVTFDGQI